MLIIWILKTTSSTTADEVTRPPALLGMIFGEFTAAVFGHAAVLEARSS
jgi:hypothetical protein